MDGGHTHAPATLRLEVRDLHAREHENEFAVKVARVKAVGVRVSVCRFN
jgi:hypothetical protein